MKLAQCINLPGNPPQEVCGPLEPGKFDSLSSIVNNAMPYVFAIAGMILLAYLVWGGFDLLTSMGDAKKAQSARSKITNAVLGFFIIFLAYWIVQIVSYVFRLEG